MNDDFDTTTILLDVETTGVNKAVDQVIELAVQYGFETYDEAAGRVVSAPVTVWRFKPTVPIHPGAQKVHGISMEMLAGCTPFAAAAFQIYELIDSAQVIIGYNVSFDLEMIGAELARAGAPAIDFKDTHIVDPYRLWQQCEPRGLQEAHRRFVGHAFESAHNAAADIAATGRVALGMIDAFALHGKDWGEIADICSPDRKLWVGGSDHFRWDFRDGAPVVIVTFGKHKGTPVTELRGYLQWMRKQDFPPHVKMICEKATRMQPAAFLAWARSVFPPPAEAPRGG
jgi:DNA polymerase-3 subunit epsilon